MLVVHLFYGYLYSKVLDEWHHVPGETNKCARDYRVSANENKDAGVKMLDRILRTPTSSLWQKRDLVARAFGWTRFELAGKWFSRWHCPLNFPSPIVRYRIFCRINYRSHRYFVSKLLTSNTTKFKMHNQRNYIINLLNYKQILYTSVLLRFV